MGKGKGAAEQAILFGTQVWMVQLPACLSELPR